MAALAAAPTVLAAAPTVLTTASAVLAVTIAAAFLSWLCFGAEAKNTQN